ncbi:UNVERIFIED_CONTAM: hypothetical protein O8I53_08285 [Campylobacter lari]
MFTLQLEQKYTRYIKQKIKLILIVNNANIFNSLQFAKNPEVLTLNINKPDQLERRKFLSTILSNIPLKNKSLDLNDTNVLKEATTVTDGLSFREILQMMRVLHSDNNIDIDFKDFKSLYRMIYFSKKDSE